MQAQNVELIDQSRNVVATALVDDEGTHFGGTIDLGSMPADLRAIFDEFEEMVNDQAFSLLDEMQAKISDFAIKAHFDDGLEALVTDLQVYPSTGDVSFKLAGTPALATKSA